MQTLTITCIVYYICIATKVLIYNTKVATEWENILYKMFSHFSFKRKPQHIDVCKKYDTKAV